MFANTILLLLTRMLLPVTHLPVTHLLVTHLPVTCLPVTHPRWLFKMFPFLIFPWKKKPCRAALPILRQLQPSTGCGAGECPKVLPIIGNADASAERLLCPHSLSPLPRLKPPGLPACPQLQHVHVSFGFPGLPSHGESSPGELAELKFPLVSICELLPSIKLC